MVTAIAYHLILGKPLIAWLGILTLLSFLLAVAIAILNRLGIHGIPARWHPGCAAVAILLALIHGTVGLLAY